MNDLSTATSALDQLLAELLPAYDAATDKSAFRAAAYERHPEVCDELASLFAIHDGGCDAHPAPPAPPRRLERGDRVGPYRVERFLAAGGMGEVYEAHHERLGRNVALKVARAGPPAERARTRFLREQQVLAKLHQTHIVAIYESAVEGDLEYFAMPLIAGAPLHSVVRTAYARETSAAGGSTPSLAHLVTSIEGVPAAPPVEPLPVGVEPRCLRLSTAYFRSAAEVMAQAAEAVQYAHDAGVLHRDIKPSNLMVDRGGHCWIIDFGLAGYRAGAANAPTEATEDRVTRGAVGTPAYMAPEQYAGTPDGRSDVWGLGATLYELLTLRPAFQGTPEVPLVEQIERGEPRPPRELAANLPRDLTAICRMALRKDPAERYQMPGALAADLRRWLNLQPTVAAPARTPRRIALWARRNKGWAAAIVAAIAAIVAGVLVNGYINRLHLQAATDRAAALQGELRERDRAATLRKLHELRLGQHVAGWSADAREQARAAAKQFADLDLRNQAAATLSGPDAYPLKQFDKFGASAVAFDASGERLLIGGVTALPPHNRPAEGAKVWDGKRDTLLHTSSRTGDGPVAFRADRTPLQLVANAKDRHALTLWNVAKDSPAGEFRHPTAGPPQPATPELAPAMLLSADGGTVAAAFPRADGANDIAVWDATSSEVITQFVDKADCLAVSPGRALFAHGDVDGRIVVRSLPKGEVVATLKSDRPAVTCLAFQRDPRRTDAVPGWLLGAGDESGTVTVWDVAARVPRCVCRGSIYQVAAVAFSPDGTIVAAVARGPCRLWDAATGRPLLDLPQTGSFPTAVAFTPDGSRVATSGIAAFGPSGSVQVWQLESDRGLQTLAGLTARTAKVAFSPDESLLAALAQDFRIGVWNLKTGARRHIFETPRAAWVDNVAIAISPDNRHLAYAGSELTRGQFVVWDLATGAEVSRGTYPPGSNNILAFAANNRLLLFQIEERDAKHFPVARKQPVPIVYCARDLRGDPAKPLYQIADFNRHIDFPCASLDGRIVAMVGYFGDGTTRHRRVAAFDGMTGKELWSSRAEMNYPRESEVYLSLDRSGCRLAQWTPALTAKYTVSSIELPSGKFLGEEPGNIGGGLWSPDAPYWVVGNYPGHPGGLAILRRGEREPVVILDLDRTASGFPQFDAAGTRYAWGNADGTVSVADIPAIQRRLAAIGLGWQ